MRSIIFLVACATMALAKTGMNKCKNINSGKGKRRYSTPKTFPGNKNPPMAIELLIDNRDALMNVFKAGKRDDVTEVVSENAFLLGQFSDAVGDQYLGQIYRATRQSLVTIVRDSEPLVRKEMGEEMGNLYRDNSQRITRAVRDMVMSPEILEFLEEGKLVNFGEAMYAKALMDKTDGGKVYQNFMNNYADEFIPIAKVLLPEFKKISKMLIDQVTKVIEDEKAKQGYRQLVNELPLVYQIFNDEISNVIIGDNVDKSLHDAIADEIILTLTKNNDDKQIASMIQRHQKFIKKIMLDRTMQQQKEKVVGKVMEKNKELMAAAGDQEMFEKLVAEANKAGKELTEELKNKIWNDIKEAKKIKQSEEAGDQIKAGNKSTNGLTRFQHLSALMSLMPDELEESIADMVKESCPELDLIQIDTPEMQAIVEAQPANFIDQLIEELHEVCDLFGLIDETKIVKKTVNGVDIEFYAADWMKGEKVEW